MGGAIDAYGRAVAVTPDDPGAANNLAWALLQDPVRWPEAEPIIERALARQPEPRGYYLDTLGALRLRKGDGQGALDAFRAALADTGASGRPRARARAGARRGGSSPGSATRAAAARCRALAAEEAKPGGHARRRRRFACW